MSKEAVKKLNANAAEKQRLKHQRSIKKKNKPDDFPTKHSSINEIFIEKPGTSIKTIAPVKQKESEVTTY